jgi:putative component of membrane protein insertase Oxa1/YidC/SpoIIIJ protein YidD
MQYEKLNQMPNGTLFVVRAMKKPENAFAKTQNLLTKSRCIRMLRVLVLPFIALIKIYQKTLSKWIDVTIGPKCKYHPSCSHYAVDALEIYNLAGLPFNCMEVNSL